MFFLFNPIRFPSPFFCFSVFSFCFYLSFSARFSSNVGLIASAALRSSYSRESYSSLDGEDNEHFDSALNSPLKLSNVRQITYCSHVALLFSVFQLHGMYFQSAQFVDYVGPKEATIL
jgi:hypothetical protein